MLKFKKYLVEYLTDEQRAQYSKHKMTPKARRDTDHFFGKGNDVVHGEIQNDDKSEIHTQLEKHLNQPISHEDYKRGAVKDKYGRDVKIGRMIKDNNLRNQFDQDPSRKLATSVHKTRTVRGVEVAGQTNPTPNAEHPNGHSWKDSSCKNIEDGINRHYLKKEIQHGTVVHFVHDHNGQEIYRATLHPHHNSAGRVAYAVDAEYGLKHPKFTEDAHRIAVELSGKPRGNIVHDKHDEVYNDNGVDMIIHPNASDTHLMRTLKSKDWATRSAVLEHPKLNHAHLMQAMKDEDHDNVMTALRHKNITHEHIAKVISRSDPSPDLLGAAYSNPKATAEQLDRGLKHEWSTVRAKAVTNPNMTHDRLERMQDDEHHKVRIEVVRHPNATSDHVDKAVHDEHWMVRKAAARSPHATEKHLSTLINDEDGDVVEATARHPKLTTDHITTIMRGPHEYARQMVTLHPNFNEQHLDMAVKDKNENVSSEAAIHHQHQLTPEHLNILKDHPHWTVRHVVANHPSTPERILRKLAKDRDHDVSTAAQGALSEMRQK